jgi:SAM-dependent methyltransferase
MATPEPDEQGGGVGSAYRGAAAEAYFDFQRSIGELGGCLDRSKFEREIRPTDVVVDFGCGTGALLAQLSARTKIGIEVSDVARRAATERGLLTVSSSAEIDAESVDVVISNHALEHALRPLDELRGLHRILRREARALASPRRLARTEACRTGSESPPLHLDAATSPQSPRRSRIRGSRVPGRAPRVAARLSTLPRPLFDALATLWAVLRRQRQLMAVAMRP